MLTLSFPSAILFSVYLSVLPLILFLFSSSLCIFSLTRPPAKPLNSATTVSVNAGTQPVVVARCESKDGRPAAKIQWLTTAKGNWTEKSQTAADNTVTVTSEYRLAPTAMDNGKDLTCLVNHRTQLKDESLPLKLAIQCKTPSPHTHTEGPCSHDFPCRSH